MSKTSQSTVKEYIDNMITKPTLNPKEPCVVGTPTYADSTTIIDSYQPDMTNSETQINITASEEDRSAKWCFPNVTQDIPEGGKNQYQ